LNSSIASVCEYLELYLGGTRNSTKLSVHPRRMVITRLNGFEIVYQYVLFLIGENDLTVKSIFRLVETTKTS